MNKFLISTLLLVLIGSDDTKIYFEKRINFEFINLQDLSKDITQDDIPMLNYTAYVSDIEKEGNKFSIFLVDANQNKKYNDATDVIMINPSNISDPTNITFTNRLKNPKSTLFSINNKVFKISNIRKNKGKNEAVFNWSSISPEKVQFQNRMIDKLPNIDFSMLDGERKNLLDYANKNKFIYVEFWGIGCTSCIQMLPNIDALNKKFSDKLEILSLVYEKTSNKEKVVEIIKKYNMTWHQGFSNNELRNKLSFNYNPMGFLFNSIGELVLYDTSPSQVQAYLEKHLGENLK